MDMVEKVARALCRQVSSLESECNCEDCHGWPEWKRHARAAIEAMREPTLEMNTAGFNEWLIWQDQGPCSASYPVYQAMIDAALPAPKEGSHD